MNFSEGSSSEILGRLSTAYGVETQKQLAEKLGVSAANVSNWVQRNSVPGSAFVRCALDTGCDLQWLATGRLAKSNPSRSEERDKASTLFGRALLKNMLSSGGKTVLQRILQAYGFQTQKELSDYLDISTGTISTWVRRGYFPGDVVITCALDTGISLEFLATGRTVQSNNSGNFINLLSYKLIDGKLEKHKDIYFDKYFNDSFVGFSSLSIICLKETNYFIQTNINEPINGYWLVKIANSCDLYHLAVLPSSRIKLSHKSQSFTCDMKDVELIGIVRYKFESFDYLSLRD